MIPQTNKELLVQLGNPAKIYTHTYTHTTNATSTQTYTNPNVYAVIAVISAQAGSGDIVNTDYQPLDHAKYYNAGRSGNSLVIKLNNVAKLSLSGGAGSQGGALRGDRSWRGTTKGWSDWTYYTNTKQVAQNGQTGALVLTIPPKGSVSFTYTYQNASNASFKGGHTISVLY